MVKKSVQFFLVLFVLLYSAFRIPNSASAQEFNSEKAYSDYVFTRSQYDDAYRKYEIAKESYQKNQTLTLKEDARIATINMLKTRDDLHRVYLTVLRTKINEAKGLTDDEKGSLFTKLDSEVLFFQGHKLTYTGNENLTDVFKINDDVEKHYKNVTTPNIYEALFFMTYSEVVDARKKHQTIYQNMVDLLNTKIAQGVLIVDPFNRWIVDITAILDTLEKRELSSKAKIQEMYTKRSTLVFNTYQSALSIINQSIVDLPKLNKFVSEFTTAINNQI